MDRVFKNGVLRRVFGPKREEIRGRLKKEGVDWIQLANNMAHVKLVINLYIS